MVKRGKYFVPPQKECRDFKELFNYAASVGAGRPVDKDGFAVGPWTAELLADAISNIKTNRTGVELRTVQHWFQDNEKGIGAENIRWLARIFGCGDPDASGEWQVALSAANRRLRENRRRNNAGASAVVRKIKPNHTRADTPAVVTNKASRRVDLAAQTEALFDSQSSMALPLVVFTGACALALIAFSLNVHSVIYTTDNGHPKQVGFLWAPNWTIVFLAVLPLSLAQLIDLLPRWKEEWRPRLANLGDPAPRISSWEHRLNAASYAFWATFFITMVVASGYNWTATHLIPLLRGHAGNLAIDWGRIAIVQPDLISIPSAIAFSGLVFLYNGFTAYLFFTGHTFLHLMKHDYLDLVKGLEGRFRSESIPEIEEISYSLMSGIFQCTALGVVITILMKLQSTFLQSDSINLAAWLVSDLVSPFGSSGSITSGKAPLGVAPGNYYSFFCLLAIVGTFANASTKIRWSMNHLHQSKARNRFFLNWLTMDGTMLLLVISYFLIGVILGASILLLFSLAVTGYLLTKPASPWGQSSR